jgi:hypothetical protein
VVTGLTHGLSKALRGNLAESDEARVATVGRDRKGVALCGHRARSSRSLTTCMRTPKVWPCRGRRCTSGVPSKGLGQYKGYPVQETDVPRALRRPA